MISRSLSQIRYRKIFQYVTIILVTAVFFKYVNHKKLKEFKNPEKYLVNSKYCKIPAYEIFNKEMMDLLTYKEYRPCSKEPLLTKVIFQETSKTYKLISETLETCYFGENTYDTKKLLPKEVELKSDTEFVFVKCFNSVFKNIYSNLHGLIPYKPKVYNRTKTWDLNKRRPPSILILGIDTMSRLNFFRAMKQSSKTIINFPNKWFSLEGYNKVGMNTFPNMLAALRGWSNNDVQRICDPANKYLDNHCILIWDDFQKNGYVTAYAEDTMQFSTFKFWKKGFKNAPTDYYFIPETQLETIFTQCIGSKRGSEIIMDYALDFTKRFKDDPYFGLFWVNDFSHNSISEPTSMDKRFNEFLMELLYGDILDNTIVFLMSDHGIRFGEPRNIPFIGSHEDFLPMMFISIPTWLKKERPDIVQALEANKNKLTSPFDIYMTLKNILEFSKPELENFPPYYAAGCQLCQSLFKEVKIERSCNMAGIPVEFCSCENNGEFCDKKMSFEIGNIVINHINAMIRKHNKNSKVLCRYIDIKSAPSVTQRSDGIFKAILFILPDGIIESIVEKKKVHKFKKDEDIYIVKSVQRIDAMGVNASEMCHVERQIYELCFCL